MHAGLIPLVTAVLNRPPTTRSAYMFIVLYGTSCIALSLDINQPSESTWRPSQQAQHPFGYHFHVKSAT